MLESILIKKKKTSQVMKHRLQFSKEIPGLPFSLCIEELSRPFQGKSQKM